MGFFSPIHDPEDAATLSLRTVSKLIIITVIIIITKPHTHTAIKLVKP
jgi:hypothetical protein